MLAFLVNVERGAAQCEAQKHYSHGDAGTTATAACSSLTTTTTTIAATASTTTTVAPTA